MRAKSEPAILTGMFTFAPNLVAMMRKNGVNAGTVCPCLGHCLIRPQTHKLRPKGSYLPNPSCTIELHKRSFIPRCLF